MTRDEVQALRNATINHILRSMKEVGKTKLQKLVYFFQESAGGHLGYFYRMYHYGPYSFDLDDDLSRLRLRGVVNTDPDPSGYGFRIQLVDPGEDPKFDLPQDYKEKLDRIIELLGNLDAQQLSLRATVHFVDSMLDSGSADDVVRHVQRLKPQFSPTTIKAAYDELREAGLLRGH